MDEVNNADSPSRRISIGIYLDNCRYKSAFRRFPVLVLPGLVGCAEPTPFKTFGVVLFPGFDLLDVAGPLEVMGIVAHDHKVDIALISETMEDPSIKPTHTYMNAPDFEVLVIPGGMGMRAPNMNTTLKFITDRAPKVKHILTICTGSALAARAGIMNGKKATTNKSSWPGVVGYGPNTTWIPRARWVEDNSGPVPVWSSSGVSAGLDLTLHFVDVFYNTTEANNTAKIIEFMRDMDPNNDPFARNSTSS